MRKDTLGHDTLTRHPHRLAFGKFAAARLRQRSSLKASLRRARAEIRLAMDELPVPRREVVADRLADILFALDEGIFVTECDVSTEFGPFGVSLHRMYQEVDAMLRQISN